MKTKFVLAFCLFFSLVSCVKRTDELGSEKNPIKIYFLPSVDANVLKTSTDKFKNWLEKNTPYKYEIGLPSNFQAIVEAFGTKRADFAITNSFGYAEAHEKYKAEAHLTVTRHGSTVYQSAFFAKANSGIKTIEDIKGKKIAYVDPISTSGYMLPSKTLSDKKITPGQSVFAGKHDVVIMMIYQGQVDVGAAFYVPPFEGKLADARRLLKTQYPDVDEKVKVIATSEELPNDPVTVRAEISPEIKKTVLDALQKYVASEEGKAEFQMLYGIDGFKPCKDSDYTQVIAMMKKLSEETNKTVK